MTDKDCHSPNIVLTGATGLVGHYLLAELLHRGCRCQVVLRGPIDEARVRVVGLLRDLDLDADRHLADGSLLVAKGDLPDRLPRLAVDESTILVHVAAATNFELNAAGEPDRTNIAGTRHLFAWVKERGLKHVHLVSSAYTCGLSQRPVEEAFNPHAPEFHNDYERTKWESERIGMEWAGTHLGNLTIYRPSIVVGAFETGRATRFSGIYLSARATELLERMYRDRRPCERHAIPLRICARPLERQNIVPVDYVAAMMATVICAPRHWGRVYNLVHPEAPTNLQIKQAFETYFDIGGGRFVPPEIFECAELNEQERSFYEVSRSIRHYLVDSPCFIRTNTAAVEQAHGIRCPSYDAEAIARLVRYAQAVSWGRRPSTPSEGPGCAEYFESFLPAHIPKSRVARMASLTATIRFVIEDEPNGQWVCRFDRGRLAGVDRGVNGRVADFGYRASRDAFWDSISGRHHPQGLFLTGRAEVFGDVERALKMAMILHSFTQEFPCDRTTLAQLGEKPCSKS